MISPHTPPGTKIVCINAEPIEPPNVPNVTWVNNGLHGLRLGAVYTVRDIVIDPLVGCFDVRLVEIVRNLCPDGYESGFNLSRFRRVDLPKCLTDIIERAKTPFQQKERV